MVNKGHSTHQEVYERNGPETALSDTSAASAGKRSPDL